MRALILSESYFEGKLATGRASVLILLFRRRISFQHKNASAVVVSWILPVSAAQYYPFAISQYPKYHRRHIAYMPSPKRTSAAPAAWNIPPLVAVDTSPQGKPAATTASRPEAAPASAASAHSTHINECQRKLDAMEAESLQDISDASKELQNISDSLGNISRPAPAGAPSQATAAALSLKPFSLKKK